MASIICSSCCAPVRHPSHEDAGLNRFRYNCASGHHVASAQHPTVQHPDSGPDPDIFLNSNADLGQALVLDPNIIAGEDVFGWNDHSLGGDPRFVANEQIAAGLRHA